MNFSKTPPRVENDRNRVKQFRVWRPGEIIANRWFVHRVIPPSNMGIVYFCYDMGLGIPVVIKSIPPQFLSDEHSQKQFIAECETWIRLGQHPNIVEAYFVETVNTYPHVFVEWVNGRDIYHAGLDSWLGTPALTLERSLDIVAQVCEGMQYAIQVLENNAQIFIHRDIKPSNILVTNDWIAKITDFGIAKARTLSGTSERPNMASLGTADGAHIKDGYSNFIGTPPYMSPEHFKGLPFMTVRSDIYSLGCTLFEMITGRPIFDANDWNTWQKAHLHQLPPRLSDICSLPRHVDALVASCLAKDPADRPQSFAELKRGLISQ